MRRNSCADSRTGFGTGTTALTGSLGCTKRCRSSAFQGAYVQATQHHDQQAKKLRQLRSFSLKVAAAQRASPLSTESTELAVSPFDFAESLWISHACKICTLMMCIAGSMIQVGLMKVSHFHLLSSIFDGCLSTLVMSIRFIR